MHHRRAPPLVLLRRGIAPGPRFTISPGCHSALASHGRETKERVNRKEGGTSEAHCAPVITETGTLKQTDAARESSRAADLKTDTPEHRLTDKQNIN